MAKELKSPSFAFLEEVNSISSFDMVGNKMLHLIIKPGPLNANHCIFKVQLKMATKYLTTEAERLSDDQQNIIHWLKIVRKWQVEIDRHEHLQDH